MGLQSLTHTYFDRLNGSDCSLSSRDKAARLIQPRDVITSSEQQLCSTKGQIQLFIGER